MGSRLRIPVLIVCNQLQSVLERNSVNSSIHHIRARPDPVTLDLFRAISRSDQNVDGPTDRQQVTRFAMGVITSSSNRMNGHFDHSI